VHAAERTAAAPRAAPKQRAPILVIDDSLTTRMLEQSILESAGYEVDLAVSGEEGMDKARLRKYALFLVDVEMPGMDGFTFIERTRRDPELRQVPAILVTSRASPEDIERGRAVGALAHIEKREFNQTDLLERIRKLVS
ncbi:MAG TPA: response regulator, partial [Polyangiaceae bacterium]